MVVDIKNDQKGHFLFNCQPWSCYTEENERFFIGSFQTFEFLSIHHIGLLQDYQNFIRPMAMFNKMIKGYKFKTYAVRAVDVSCLKRLLESKSDIPIYIKRLFQNFLNNTKKIEINMQEMNKHKEGANSNSYGYRLFKPLFFLASTASSQSLEIIHLTKILNLFKHKLKNIEIYNIQRAIDGFKPSISLNNLFMEEIIASIELINESVSLQSVFKEFIIVEPKESITNFINKQQALFNKYGWTLKKTKYEHPRRRSNSNSLSITRL